MRDVTWSTPSVRSDESERLCITPSPYHDDTLIDALCEALVDVWQRLGLCLKDQALAAE
jgi:5-aminolevulinate synthase